MADLSARLTVVEPDLSPGRRGFKTRFADIMLGPAGSRTAPPEARRNMKARGRFFPTVGELRRRWYQNPCAFEAVLDNAARHARRLLVLGAGRGLYERDHRAPGRQVVGVDVGRAIADNPMLDEIVIYDGRSLPFDTNTFDCCSARWVLEHVPDPRATLAEVVRVLRPGGRFVFMTTNAWFYGSIAARLIPNRFHAGIVRRMTGRGERDTFPTYFRANTRRRLRRMLTSLGLREESMMVELDDPDYLQFSLPTYLLGVAYQRVVAKSRWLEDLGQTVIGSYVKHQDGAGRPAVTHRSTAG